MGCLDSTRIAEIQTQLVSLKANLAAIDTAISDGTLHITSYTFDSGEARQRTEYKSLDELFKTRDLIQSQIDRLNRILRGQGVVNLNLRRHG